MEFPIPVCYFPTTVMFIDDRERFLTGLALNLPRDLSYQMYTNPQNALKAYHKNPPKLIVKVIAVSSVQSKLSLSYCRSVY